MFKELIGLHYYILTGSHSTNGLFHRFCNATSSVNDCHLYLMESVTFVCPCNQIGCSVLWSFSNVTLGQEYNINNVTYSDGGEVTCNNDVRKEYVWNVTVSQPSK